MCEKIVSQNKDKSLQAQMLKFQILFVSIIF